MTGQIMGTPQYMAPEQIEHPQDVDHRADIYSLGVVFYQMLTGELPIGRFAPPSRKVQIDVRLDEVVLRALEKEPERRYQQASEIKTRVETIATTPSDNVGRRCATGSASVFPSDDAKHSGTPRPSTGEASGAPVPPVAEPLHDRSLHRRYRIRQPLVVRRNGERAVNWPALAVRSAIGLFGILVVSLLFSLAMLPFHAMRVGPLLMFLPSAACLVGGTVALSLAVTIRLLRGLSVPLDELPDANEAAGGLTGESSSVRAAPGSDGAIEQARRQVRGPAIGLLVTGILNWVTLTAAAIVMGYMAMGAEGPLRVIMPVPVISAFACGILMILAALKMQRLQAYWLAVAASILAIIISPSNLIGLPIGVWALVVLSQPEVRAAFGRRSRSDRRSATGSASVLPSDDARHPGTPLPSTGEADGTPAADYHDRVSRAAYAAAPWSPEDVPWQIWVVVVWLAIEGVGNLLSVPTQPQAINWLLAKCLFVVGLLRGWRWVFVMFQLAGVIHVFGFMNSAPFVALANLLLMVLTGSAYRFFFSRTGKSAPIHEGIWNTIARKTAPIVFGVLALVMLSVSPTELYEWAQQRFGFGGSSQTRIAKALEEYRHTLIGYDLGFGSVFPRQKWTHYDAARLEKYPTKDAWPPVLGQVDTNPDAFNVVRSRPTSTSVISGPTAFMVPLDRSLVTDGYTTLLFLADIRQSGTVMATSYTSLVCLGNMEGRLHFDSYATALVEGDVSGQITSRSYFNLLVTGKFSGQISADSYAMMYLLGGCEGSLELRNHAKVYIARRTVKTDLSRIKGRGQVYLEDSDLPPGEHRIGDLTVTVANGAASSKNAAEPGRSTQTIDSTTGKSAELPTTMGDAAAGKLQKIKSFGTAAQFITKDGITVDQNAWRVEAKGNRAVRLFEIPSPGVENCRVVYRARLKAERLEGRAYLEMWCRMPGGGEYFSKGLQNPVTGTTDWASYETPFFLKKGERPDLIKLNVIVDGKGALWIKDVELSKAPLGPEAGTGSPFEARLPSGVTVELLGVSGHPSKENSWWRPDGSPLAKPPCDPLKGSVGGGADHVAREFAVQWHNLPAEPVGTQVSFDPPYNAYAGDNPKRVGQKVAGLEVMTVSLPDQKTVTVRVHVAAGPWQTVVETERGVTAMGTLKGGFAFSPVEEKDGRVTITVSHDILGPESRRGGRRTGWPRTSRQFIRRRRCFRFSPDHGHVFPTLAEGHQSLSRANPPLRAGRVSQRGAPTGAEDGRADCSPCHTARGGQSEHPAKPQGSVLTYCTILHLM